MNEGQTDFAKIFLVTEALQVSQALTGLLTDGIAVALALDTAASDALDVTIGKAIATGSIQATLDVLRASLIRKIEGGAVPQAGSKEALDQSEDTAAGLWP